jgi:hypothetical protein
MTTSRHVALLLTILAAPSCFQVSYDHPACSTRGECPEGFACASQRCVPPGEVPPSIDAMAPTSDSNPAPADAPDVDAVPDATPCPGGYIDLGVPGSKYRIGAVASTWLAAERYCEDDSGGTSTHLAVLDDEAEVAAVAPRVTMAWIGLSDRRTEGDFLTVTGGRPLFQPWAPGDPNDMFGEDCVELDGTTINDEECNDQQLFICECDGRPPDPAAY